MELEVYDTWARTVANDVMHFDVLVPRGQGHRAIAFARQWLQQLGFRPESVRIEQCRFCHREEPGAEIQQHVQRQGFFVLQLEGCPGSV